MPALLGPHLEEIANTAVPGLDLCGAVVAVVFIGVAVATDRDTVGPVVGKLRRRRG